MLLLKAELAKSKRIYSTIKTSGVSLNVLINVLDLAADAGKMTFENNRLK
jgi:hypothetical protein